MYPFLFYTHKHTDDAVVLTQEQDLLLPGDLLDILPLHLRSVYSEEGGQDLCRGQESYNWTDQTAAHMMQRHISGREIQD